MTRMAYFSENDLALINAHRKPASRFGFAVLLCYLKNVGFTPDKKIPPSDALLKHIANRLKLSGDLWLAYLSGRDSTRREHLTELYLYTVYMERAVDALKRKGLKITSSCCRICPR